MRKNLTIREIYYKCQTNYTQNLINYNLDYE
jgi:hypothetical protein